MPRKAPAAPKDPETVTLNPEPGRMRDFGGAQSDRWNAHLMGKLVAALPGYHNPDKREDTIHATAGGRFCQGSRHCSWPTGAWSGIGPLLTEGWTRMRYLGCGS